MKQRIALGLFLCLALVQLAVPASMIVRRELTLHSGRQYRFQTAPVDPYDPFRGRYVALNLHANTAPRPLDLSLTSGQRVYAILTEDAEGFATIASLALTPPGGDAYFQTHVSYVSDDRVHIAIPFDRYYTDEHLAPAAERAYWQHSRLPAHEAYITVRIKDGLAVLEELYIAGKPLQEFLQQNAEQK
jgi:uncharacterized membrane-anchored protein